jgi:2-methylcitrate dehydratase PrpD
MDSLPLMLGYLADTRYRDLPDEVVENAKRFILDSLGVAVAGSVAPGSGEVVELVGEWGGKAEATVICSGLKVPSPWAAFANSVMMHAFDFDDTLDESALHAHVSVLPAALAVAQSRGASGADLICAVVLGVDLVARMGLSTKRPLSWIRTATCGTFGASVAAGKLLGLTKGKLSHALGIAYSQTAGNAQCLVDGGLVKRMQPAFSSKAGVLSAYLAGRGVTGARDSLEGEYGFFNLYEGGEYDRERLLDGLGKRFGGMDLSVKPYPSCRMTHASIDAALAMRKEKKIDPEGIDEIVVRVSKMCLNMVGRPFVIRTNPQVDAQFSIPYTVAKAMIRGDVFLEDFEESNIRDEKVLRLAARVRVEEDEDLRERDMTASFLSLKYGGSVHEKRVVHMKGSPANPMSLDECIDKFRKCCSYSRNKAIQERVEDIVERVVHLEEENDIARVMGLFS